MISHEPLTVAFCGAGHRARILLEVMRGISGYRIAALADPSREFLETAAGFAPEATPLYNSYQEMLAGEAGLDAMVIASPGGLHAGQAVAALEQGLHVFCEKPIATSAADADRMIGAATRAGKVLAIGHQMRFDPIYQKILELVRGGQTGEIRFASGYLYRKDWNPASWCVPHPRTGAPTPWRHLRALTGSSLLEDGLHELDILHTCIGSRPRRVSASGGNSFYGNRETIDHAAIVVEYENGAMLQFGFSLFGVKRDEEMVMIGSQAVLRTSGNRVELHRRGETDPAQWAVELPARTSAENPAGSIVNPSVERCLQDFAQSIRTGRQPACDGAAGREVAQIAILAQRSIERRRGVNWEELNP